MGGLRTMVMVIDLDKGADYQYHPEDGYLEFPIRLHGLLEKEYLPLDLPPD